MEALNRAEVLLHRLHHHGEVLLASSNECMANTDSCIGGNDILVYVRIGHTQCPPLLGVLHLIVCFHFVAMLHIDLTIVTYCTDDRQFYT